MKRNILIGIIPVFVILVIVGGVKYLQIHAMMTAPQPTQVESISSAIAAEQKWQDALPAVGSVSAEQGVTVAPEIAGTVSEIAFESGASVHKGDLLVKLDSSSEEAQLRAAQAQVDLARVTAERDRKLRQDNTVSQSELDQAEATLKQMQANADAIQSVIDKKTIRAPFDGKLGIRLVNLGESLNVGQGIVSLQSLSSVFVDFSLPQQDLSLLQTGLKVHATSDTYPDKSFDGELTAINPDLDTMTRSVRLRAKFDNSTELLRPGMFARVEVLLPDQKPVLAIPATAILSAPYGDSVFVVQKAKDSDGLVVEQKFVHTGKAHGDFVSIESGLSAGDQIATAGVFKLRNGASVTINNEGAPKPSLTPNPPNS